MIIRYFFKHFFHARVNEDNYNTFHINQIIEQ